MSKWLSPICRQLKTIHYFGFYTVWKQGLSSVNHTSCNFVHNRSFRPPIFTLEVRKFARKKIWRQNCVLDFTVCEEFYAVWKAVFSHLNWKISHLALVVMVVTNMRCAVNLKFCDPISRTLPVWRFKSFWDKILTPCLKLYTIFRYGSMSKASRVMAMRLNRVRPVIKMSYWS